MMTTEGRLLLLLSRLNLRVPREEPTLQAGERHVSSEVRNGCPYHRCRNSSAFSSAQIDLMMSEGLQKSLERFGNPTPK
eukprot:3392267-Amphidinium_carterae.1